MIHREICMLYVACNDWLFSDPGNKLKRRPNGKGWICNLFVVTDVAKLQAEYIMLLNQGFAKHVKPATGQRQALKAFWNGMADDEREDLVRQFEQGHGDVVDELVEAMTLEAVRYPKFS
jgi:hypothetical protein